MSTPALRALARPIVDDNPVTMQVLGICSALAVTRRLDTALLMSVSVICVLTLSNVSISLLRNHLPRSIRLIVQITVIATLVTVVDQLLRAFAWELSRQLSVFVGLIVTNCIVLGRGDSFAMFHGGSLLGVPVLVPRDAGGWYEPAALLLLPPSAFFLIGGLVWAVRSWKTQQVEAAEPVPEAAAPEPVR
jgi:Na+-transporting NADH:ubiquinone oxidoreductase subunit D